MKKQVFMLFVVCLATLSVSAQPKFHVDLGYNYNLGLSEKIVGTSFGRGTYKMGGHSLRLSARYDITSDLSAGMGLGVERYTEFDFNTLPVFLTLRYKPLKKMNDAYVFTDLGYALNASDNHNPGFTGKLGIGYVFHIAKHFGINLQIAYDLKDFRKIPTIEYDVVNQQNKYYNTNSVRHSISFGVGLTF